jgi:hypothetical protein
MARATGNARKRPNGDGFLTRLLLGLGFLGRDRRPRGLPRQPLGLEPLLRVRFDGLHVLRLSMPLISVHA